MAQVNKIWGRIQRHRRIRKKVIGSAERPRVVVNRSLTNISVQAIDDESNKTLASISSRSSEISKKGVKGKISVSEQVGKAFANLLQAKGIKQISFDRGGYLYHGRVKALAEAIRAGGIQF